MGKLMKGRKGSQRALVVVGHGELQLRQGPDDGGNDNAATPEVGRLRGDDDMIEVLKAGLWVRWSEVRRGGERARARRNSRRQWRSTVGRKKCVLYLDSLAQRRCGRAKGDYGGVVG